jgi:Mitochondrial carrier protein
MQSYVKYDNSITPTTPASIKQKLISAMFGSFVTNVAVTPLDVVRTRLQSQGNFNHPGEFRINGTLDGLRRIAQYEGFLSLWRGLSAALMMSIPSSAFYMSNRNPYGLLLTPFI